MRVRASITNDGMKEDGKDKVDLECIQSEEAKVTEGNGKEKGDIAIRM